MSESKPSAPAAVTPVTDQIVIGYHRRLTAEGLDSAHKLIAQIMEKLGDKGVVALDHYVAAGSGGESAFAVSLVRLGDPAFTLGDLQRLAGSVGYETIAFCERNARVGTLSLASTPIGLKTLTAFNDPLAFDQWPLATLGATEPWTATPPAGSSTIVAIVDSGLRRLDGTIHADIGAVQPIPACQPAPYADGIDREGHGTRLAGTIAALFDNSIGIASAVPATWGISLLPIKFFETGEPATAYYASTAISCAVDQGAKVVNASWHVAPADSNLTMLKSAIEYAMGKGCLVVAAAGNSGTNNELFPIYPANFGAVPPLAGNGMLTVMAVDRYDVKAWFSNYGPNTVDIAAPGVGIMTTGQYLVDPPRYEFHTGTSASAAFVSAGAALVFALNPAWTPRQVIQHLTAAADVVAGLRLACVGGRRLNLRRAVYGPIVILAPLSGTSLHAGQQAQIRWGNEYTNPDFTDVAIAFSKDDGVTWTTLAASTPNDGEFDWTPGAADRTTKARLRIAPLAGNFPVTSDKFKVV